jgi:hypothetical protein
MVLQNQGKLYVKSSWRARLFLIFIGALRNAEADLANINRPRRTLFDADVQCPFRLRSAFLRNQQRTKSGMEQ